MFCDFQPAEDGFQVCSRCYRQIRCSRPAKAQCAGSWLTPPQRRDQVCRHLGEVLRLDDCVGCTGHVQLKIYGCAHPQHAETTLRECRECPDFAGDAGLVDAQPFRVLLKQSYGLGDDVQFSIVLAHLRRLRPEWQVDVEAGNGRSTMYRDLCRRVFNSHDAAVRPVREEYDAVRSVPMIEPDECFFDSPASKPILLLRRLFKLQPIEELCRYQIAVDADDLARACACLARLAPPSGRMALIHYQGYTHRRIKNINEQHVVQLCRRLKAAGVAPIILDFDRTSALVREGVAVGIHGDDPLWGTGGIDASLIAALIRQVALFVGIDSGPGHCAGATDTPSLIYWGKGLHPLHFFDLADNVTHLVRAKHGDDLLGDRGVGLDYFRRRYQHCLYRDAGVMLPELALELLDGGRSPYTWQCDARVRRGGSCFSDSRMLRECTVDDEYQAERLPDDVAVVVDCGAHVGGFSLKAAHRWSAPRIVAVEANPANWELLAMNLGDSAEICRAALWYGDEPLELIDTVAGDSDTGATCVVPAGQPARDDWRQARGVGDYRRSRLVDRVTLEQVCARYGLDHIDVLKVDCEYDGWLAHASLDCLARIRFIVGEYHDRGRFVDLVRERLPAWRCELLRDGDPLGIFRLTNPDPWLPLPDLLSQETGSTGTGRG